MALIPNNVRAVLLSSAMTITLTMVAGEEGERTDAYPDIVGIPTICFGDTENVKLGQHATHEECLARLNKRISKLVPRVAALIKRPVGDQIIAAFSSFCDNVGIKGCSNSEAMRRIQTGDIRTGCDMLLNWTRAKDKRLALYSRRMRERALCLTGDDINNHRGIDFSRYQQPPQWFIERAASWGLKGKL